MGALNDIQAELVTSLENAGLTVVTDPRLMAPNLAMVEPPRVTGISGNLSQVEWDVNVTALPPGNAAAVEALLDQVDAVIQAVPVSTATPGVLSIGGQDLPAYTLTVTYTIRRN